MLTKILFTLVVIIGVVIFFRHKETCAAAPVVADDGGGYSISPRAVAYGLLGVLAALSVAIFVFNWHSENRVVHIRVIAAGADAETATDYRARHKSIRGRNFTTLDGARITLGEGDRIEISEP